MISSRPRDCWQSSAANPPDDAFSETVVSRVQRVRGGSRSSRKILYDGRVYQFQRAGGINRYFAELISGLPDDWEPTVTGVEEFGENVPCHQRLKQAKPPDFRPRRFQKSFQHRWWKPRFLGSFDLAHPTYYDLTSDFNYSDFQCPLVITVYDVIIAKFPGLFDNSGEIVRLQREAIRRADRIVCISRSTESDLLEWMPEANGKSCVIHLGSSLGSSAESECDDRKRTDFLFVGGRGGYKNFLFLLRVFSKAASINKDIRLLIAGAPLSSEERWQMHFLNITEKVKAVEFPNELELRKLYQKSAALLYPSRYEGFGIPPLEALGCGTLAVTANTSSLPEVVGEAGIMLDPADEDAWVNCVLQIADGRSDHRVRREEGFRQAARFSWSKCVSEHVNIYRQLSRSV